MKKIAILGHGGMLGHIVKEVFAFQHDLEVISFGRETLDVVPRSFNDIGVKLSSLMSFDTDYVINCIGAIKPTFSSTKNLTVPLYTNAIFPRQLADWGELTHTKVIHLTTDCITNGSKGQYIETDIHDATDDYGRSKSLGEPPNAMVIRTSIIGPEIEGRRRSFFEWLRSNKGGRVSGFKNHLWNGLTTLELAHCLLDIIESNKWEMGTFHVFAEDISKANMIKEISRIFNWNIQVDELDAPESINRTLRTIKPLNDFLRNPSFCNMITELRSWERARVC